MPYPSCAENFNEALSVIVVGCLWQSVCEREQPAAYFELESVVGKKPCSRMILVEV